MMKALLSPFLHLLLAGEGRGPGAHPHRRARRARRQPPVLLRLLLPSPGVRRRVTFVAKAEYFDSWKTAWFFRAAGQIPMNRSGGDASQRALDTATGVLGGGGMLAIYPEGTRAPDPRLHRGKTGVARLSLGCDVPVIPVGIVGTRAVQPPGSMIMRPFHTVTVRFGAPVAYLHRGTRIVTGCCGGGGTAPDGGERAPAEPAELRALTDALMAEIAALSGQEYVDEYASRSRRDPPSRGPEGPQTEDPAADRAAG